MRQIVFFNSSIEVGGPGRVISLWSNYFNKKGFNVEIVSNIETKPFFRHHKNIKISFLGIEKFKQKNFLISIFRIFNFLKYRRDQLLIFNKGLYIPYLYLLKKFGLINRSLKLIYYIHGGSSDLKVIYDNLRIHMINNTFDKVIALHDDYGKYKNPIKKNFKRKLLDFIFPLSSRIVCKKKIVYIPNPLSFSIKSKIKYRSKIILSVGRLDPVKGFDLLIKSWDLIYQKHLDWKLQIIGSGEQKIKLLNLINKNNTKNIELIDQKKSIKSFYENASIYAMSSREEGFPMVLLEAMSAGLPIVGFKNVGAKALIKDKNNGFLVKSNDIKGFAKCSLTGAVSS